MISKGITLIIISMLVFGVLNLIENMIHYTIGRNSDNNYYSKNNKKYLFNFPSGEDFIKIIITMIIFGLAQGIITEYIMKE